MEAIVKQNISKRGQRVIVTGLSLMQEKSTRFWHFIELNNWIMKIYAYIAYCCWSYAPLQNVKLWSPLLSNLPFNILFLNCLQIAYPCYLDSNCSN